MAACGLAGTWRQRLWGWWAAVCTGLPGACWCALFSLWEIAEGHQPKLSVQASSLGKQLYGQKLLLGQVSDWSSSGVDLLFLGVPKEMAARGKQKGREEGRKEPWKEGVFGA